MSSLFSLHRPYLILFITDQRQGLSPSATLDSSNEGGDEQKKREGGAALDVTTAIIDWSSFRRREYVRYLLETLLVGGRDQRQEPCREFGG